jgi:hypothetical protein
MSRIVAGRKNHDRRADPAGPIEVASETRAGHARLTARDLGRRERCGAGSEPLKYSGRHLLETPGGPSRVAPDR